ncbi:MAG: hypothetical protein H6711_18215 [Myxococcales bacterium]|nr:hypothetical protein [Myxococcales bacterium]
MSAETGDAELVGLRERAAVGRAGGLASAAQGRAAGLRAGPAERSTNVASEESGASGGGSRGYRLGTRALDQDYASHKRDVRAAAAELRQSREVEVAAPTPAPARPAIGPLFAGVPMPPPPIDEDEDEEDDEVDEAPAIAARPEAAGEEASAALPRLLTCLPGPVAVFAAGEELLAVDLRKLRSHLVLRRLLRDLKGERHLAVQGLLTPVVVRRQADEVRLCAAAREELLGLGVDLDAFGEDAVVVRGVPAQLRSCLDDADVADLIDRVVPWLRLRQSDRRQAEPQALLSAMAATESRDPAPRLARRWIAELLEGGERLDEVPGVARWSAAALLGGR